MAEEDTWDQEIDSDQSMFDEEDAHMDDPWSETEDDYSHDPGQEEPEPEPPDHAQDHSSQKKWSEEQEDWEEQGYEENELRGDSWTEDDNFQGGYKEGPVREELKSKPPDLTWSPTHQTPLTESWVTLASDYKTYEPKLFEFSGSRNPRDYLQWEKDMDEYFKYYSIPRGERLSYCLGQLVKGAYKWWVKEEDDRWYYKEPAISTWGQLKWIMRERYAPHSLTQPRKDTHLSKGEIRRGIVPSMVQNEIPKLVKHQGKFSVPNRPLELTYLKYKNREHIAKEFPSKKVNSSTYTSCEKFVSPTRDKRGIRPAASEPLMAFKATSSTLIERAPTSPKRDKQNLSPTSPLNDVMPKTQPELTEVSISTAFQNIDHLCDKIMRLIVCTKVEKGLGTKEDPHQTNCCGQQVKKKQEIVSASTNERVQAKLSQSVYNDPMTVMMHLPLSKSVKTDAGPKGEQLDTLSPSPCREEQCEQPDQEKKAQPTLSSPLLEPQVKHTQGKFSNALNSLEVICYRCQNKGHYAKGCPTKRLTSITSLELHENNLKEDEHLANSVSKIPNASIIHLSCSKDFEKGIGMEEKRSESHISPTCHDEE